MQIFGGCEIWFLMQYYMFLEYLFNYDKKKRFGTSVKFPLTVQEYKRFAYDRNGVGHHGMCCFADNFSVEIWQDNIYNVYDIELTYGSVPYRITRHTSHNKQGYGTKITALVKRHLPKPESILEIISARTLHDPMFNVIINVIAAGHNSYVIDYTIMYIVTRIYFYLFLKRS